MDSEPDTVIHVDPQFVHRSLAHQAFGASLSDHLSNVADRITTALVEREVPDLRIAALGGSLKDLDGQIVTVRSAFHFRHPAPSDDVGLVAFHDTLQIDDGMRLLVEGTFDPRRFEDNSPRGNLSRRKNVFVVAFVQDVLDDPPTVRLRPILIGFPFYAPRDVSDGFFQRDRPEVWCGEVEEFRPDQWNASRTVSASDLAAVFSMPEEAIKMAFAEILGVADVPRDWGGERSDLVADLTLEGRRARAAFALKGPGGRQRPWTLHPGNMGKRGDQAIRLFTEPADVFVVQHCAGIAETVRHLCDALATKHGKRYMLIDGSQTARILRATGRLARSS